MRDDSANGSGHGFADVVEHCARSSCNNAQYRQAIFDDRDARQPLIEAVLRAIKQKAPSAHVLLVGYPQLFPDERGYNQVRTRRGIRSVGYGQYCAELTLWSGEQDFLREAGTRLNDVLQRAAQATNVEWVPVEATFNGHEICGVNGAWINGVDATFRPNRPLFGSGFFLGRSPIAADDESFHPKREGQDAYGAAINEYLASLPG